MTAVVPVYVPLDLAQLSVVATSLGLLTPEDRALVELVRAGVAGAETALENNAQNAEHANKVCTFLNKGSDAMYTQAPHVLAKMLRFAVRAWADNGWSEPGGPLVGPRPLPS